MTTNKLFIIEQSSAEVIEAEDAHGFPVYGKRSLALIRGEACTLFDTEGNGYLDLYGSHAVASLGYGHPTLHNALVDQLTKLPFVTNAFGNDVRARYLTQLSRVSGFDRAFLTNCGAEAIENAIKLAMAHTKRSRVIAMEKSFHGRTAGAAAVTDQGTKPFPYPQRPFACEFVPFNDASAIERTMRGDVAAVILEPIQSLAGVRVATPDYLQTLRALCDHHGAMLIFDEVQTGFGRLGAPFAHQWFQVRPDIVTLAKGIAGGLPMAATLASDALMASLAEGSLGTTFGGGPLACACASAVLDVIDEPDFLANVRRVSDCLKRGASAIPGVIEVRGAGLLLGLRTRLAARDLRAALIEQHVLVGVSNDPSVARLLPPLTLTLADAELFLNILRHVLA